MCLDEKMIRVMQFSVPGRRSAVEWVTGMICAVLVAVFYAGVPSGLLVAEPPSGPEQSKVSLEVRQFGAERFVRYGRWFPLGITLRSGTGLEKEFNGTVRVKGEKGFTCKRSVTVNPGEEVSLTLPVFSASSYKYRVHVVSEEGEVLDKMWKRRRGVLGGSDVLIGLDETASRTVRNRLRTIAKKREGTYLVTGSPDRLQSAARWPDLVDYLYLTQSPEEPEKLHTVVLEAGVEPNQLELPGRKTVNRATAPVSPESYDVFKPLSWKPTARNWLENGVWVQLLVFLTLLFLSFWFRNRYFFWGAAFLVPVCLSVIVLWQKPGSVDLLKQRVHSEVSGGELETYEKRKIGLFPRTEGDLTYSSSRIRYIYPRFFNRSSLEEFMPELRWEDGWVLTWPDFPKDGWMVLENRRPVGVSPGPFRVQLTENEVSVRNTTDAVIRHAVLFREGAYYPVGRLAPGQEKRVSVAGEGISRERFGENVFSSLTVADGTRRRWVKLCLRRSSSWSRGVAGFRMSMGDNAEHRDGVVELDYGTVLLQRLPDQE